jgi:3-methyl-2-oxobutanoate hydroxymethyltransferase
MAAALALEEAGAFAIVLELVPASVAKAISARLTIPTIGIGAGADCDGQVQVFHDIMGMYDDFLPKHSKRYAEVASIMREATARYVDEVRETSFPADEHTFKEASE